MDKFFAILSMLVVVALAPKAQASAGLVVHASEFGVGKFHREDNRVHPYGKSAWAPLVLPGDAPADPKGVLTTKNADGSFTIFFSTLEELVAELPRLADSERQSVSVLNLHGHGLPGRMWFPKDERTRNGFGCSDWRRFADGIDSDSYDQYYSALSLSEIQSIRSMSNNANVRTPCTSGLEEWRAAVRARPRFREVLAPDAQIHFLSCVVGLGTLGDTFTKGMAELLLQAGGGGRTETSMNFGLGDWSMPEGMGFWDYISDDQLSRDNEVYPRDRQDREIAQKGTIRVAISNGTSWTSALYGQRDFMSLGFAPLILGEPMMELFSVETSPELPARVRVPGTNVFVDLN